MQNRTMCSMDVQSLFTNVPLRETVDFLCDYIVTKKLKTIVPIELLKPLLLLCTENVLFTFRGERFQQVDGVAMGSPLGPFLADVFMSKVEEICKHEILDLPFYKRYVDDTLIISDTKEQAERLLCAFNSAHRNLHMTTEYESSDALPFLDLMLTRKPDGSISRTIYRKATWTGLYTNYNSFTPIKHKRALVRTLFYRARELCSPDQIDSELQFLHSTLRSNGYPESFIRTHSRALPKAEPMIGVPKKTVYLKLPFKGDEVSRLITKRLKSSVERTYNTVDLRFLTTTTKLPIHSVKSRIPVPATSHCIYQFNCNCGASYIGRTDRYLSDRIREHIPRWVERYLTRSIDNVQSADRLPASSIGRHLIESGHQINPASAFSVVYRNQNARDLKLLEAVAISRLKPKLCVQKKIFVTLKLHWGHSSS